MDDSDGVDEPDEVVADEEEPLLERYSRQTSAAAPEDMSSRLERRPHEFGSVSGSSVIVIGKVVQRYVVATALPTLRKIRLWAHRALTP